MYVIKNALKNLIRNKGRNLLFGIIIFAIILTISASVLIEMTSAQAICHYKEKFGAEVTIANTSNNQNKEKQKPLSAEELFSFSKSKYIQSKVYTAQIAIIPLGLKVLNDLENSTEGSLAAKAYVKGTNGPQVNEEFAKGMKKIVRGALYKNQNECIVSAEFAKLNGLDINDTMTVTSNIKNQPMPMQLKIVGVYEDKSLSQEAESNGPLFYAANDIYTDFGTVADSKIFQAYGTLDVKMSLKDPDMLGAFKKELKKKGLPDYFSVTVDEDSYNMMVAPIEKIAGISKKVMIIVLFSGGSILLLLSLMSIRERKYEIGVLRAMGMKKRAVAMGLIIESIVIVCICLSLGLTIAQGSQKQLSTAVIQTQIEEKEGQQQLIENLHFGSKEVAEISLTALGLVLLSSVSGVLFVTRYEPSRILAERN